MPLIITNEDHSRLTLDWLRSLDPQPRYVHFPHYSHKIPKDITEAYECVCYHMTDLPYGRGGTPLQNLILRGHTDTVITAFRATDEIDAGPIYGKRPLSLDGSAEQIYKRAYRIIEHEMIPFIEQWTPEPQPQIGEPVYFERRTPAQSQFDFSCWAKESGKSLYDFIRMLDAPGYPKAFMVSGDWRLTFSKARLVDGKLIAEVEISEYDPGSRGPS